MSLQSVKQLSVDLLEKKYVTRFSSHERRLATKSAKNEGKQSQIWRKRKIVLILRLPIKTGLLIFFYTSSSARSGTGRSPDVSKMRHPLRVI